MSLRIKLTLFTVSFVTLASLAILSVSVLQIRQKERRDIQNLRASEIKRLQNNLQNSVSLICSAVEDRMGSPEISTDLASIIKNLHKNRSASNSNWTWALDTGNAQQLVVLSTNQEIKKNITPIVEELIKSARFSGKAVTESVKPIKANAGIPSDDFPHLFWFAKSITQDGWVLAAAAPLSNLDSIITVRITNVRSEMTKMVKDRILFSLFLIIACAIAIFIFSKILLGPVNRLVLLTESIAEGRRGFTERISITSHDEIGRLTSSFNALLKHVEDSMNKLEETAAKYRELVENANSAIVHLDSKGTVLFVNEFAQKIFEYSPTEVEGKSVADTIGKSIDFSRTGDDMFLAPEKYPYLEREHITKNGNNIWVGWTNRPLYENDNTFVETLCVGSDITKSKEAELLATLQQHKLIQAEKMATLGVLVSGVAHEINNPNNYILLNAQTLFDMWQDIAPVLKSYSDEYPDYAVSGLAYTELHKEIPAMLKGIADGSRRIKAIVQNLKEFSRMEPDDMTQKVDITKVLDAAQIILSNMIKKSTHNFTVSIPHNIPPVRGNFQRIEQVIINLLTNACQATIDPVNPVIVQAQYIRSTHEIAIIVSDKGKGIKPDDMKRIFDPFFTTKRDEGGTGLGLAVSYSIVKDHGGDLKIESQEGKGTTTTLTLPVA